MFGDLFGEMFNENTQGHQQQQQHDFKQQQKQQEEIESEEEIDDLFMDTDVEQLTIQTISRFYRRSNVWVILFHLGQQDKKSAQIKEAYVTLAEKLYGITSVAAINCKIDEELCTEEFGIFDYPKILTFTEQFSDTGDAYEGSLNDWKPIADVATRKMQNFVQVVNSNNFESFSGREAHKHKVIFFNEKKSTPALIKAFSKKFHDKANFGEIKKSDT